MTGDPEILKRDCPAEYWQLISNAIIMGAQFIQPLLFMPYLSELPEIRFFVEDYDNDDPFKYKWIVDSSDAQVPYLQDGGYYQNLVTCIIEAPEKDKDLLTKKVIECGKLLHPFHEIKK